LRDKVLLVLSANSIASDGVEDEVKTAYDEERTRGQTVLFPIRIDNAVMATREAWAAKLRADRHIGSGKITTAIRTALGACCATLSEQARATVRPLSNDGEFDNARQKISDLLARERRTWKSFVDSLFSTSSKTWSDWRDQQASNPAINPLDLVHHLLWRYVDITPHQFVAVSLWIAHTFVYQRFTVTPRLMVTSPVRGCGKTTVLDLLEAMCVRPIKSDSITAGSICHAVDREHPTLLIDEADNLGLAVNGALRAVLNSGHRRGGKVTRYHGGQARFFSTFSPVAVAAIGTLPLPLMHRSIVIYMARRDGRRQLTRLDTEDPDTKADLNIAYRMMLNWREMPGLRQTRQCRRHRALAMPTIGAP
jgi:hypothetical protein